MQSDDQIKEHDSKSKSTELSIFIKKKSLHFKVYLLILCFPSNSEFDYFDFLNNLLNMRCISFRQKRISD